MRPLVEEYLATVHGSLAGNREGRIYDAIPPSPGLDEDHFGICLATVDGHLYEFGDTHAPFAIQSISKPFTYGLALADRGLAEVDRRIDVEPSGDAFNEISLEARTGRPRNPMINAGAIAAAGLVRGDDEEERYRRLHRSFSDWAGRDLDLDERVLAAELAIAHRHRAIGHLLRGAGVLDGDPDPAVDLYFRQCSLLVDCRDLALMGATLANGGEHPQTGVRALDSTLVERVLSVMTTCGMYDSAGEWVADVGLPAKSGVAGGVLAVLPGQLAIAVYSPRLDAHGNSIRAVGACRRLSVDLELHFLRVTQARRSALRASYDVHRFPSNRRRTPDEQEILDEVGHRARVFELHGDILFAGAEAVIRALTAAAEDLDVVVLDVRRVDDVAAIAQRMLADARAILEAEHCGVALVDPEGRIPHDSFSTTLLFSELDGAIAWAEDRLLRRHGGVGPAGRRIDADDHPLLAELRDEDRAAVLAVLEERTAHSGDVVVARGDEPAALFLVVAGRASAVTRRGGDVRHLAVLRPGTSFGKRSLMTGAPHSTDVCADEDSEFRVLTAEGLRRLEEQAPGAVIALLRAILGQDAPGRAHREEEGEPSDPAASPTGSPLPVDVRPSRSASP